MERNMDDRCLGSIGVVGGAKCLLVQRWAELLNPRTTATYRARHLNAHMALREIRELVDLVLKGDVGQVHLNHVREECLELLRDDTTLGTHLSQHQQRLLSNLNTCQIGQRSGQLRLKYQLGYSLPQIDGVYLTSLLTDLRGAVEGGDLDATDRLVSALVTELLSMGWSQRALYEMRTRLNRALASQSCWTDIQGMVMRQKRKYICLFLVDHELSETEKSSFITLGLSVRGPADLPSLVPYVDAGHPLPTAPAYIAVDAEAFDPYSALESAKGMLSSALDVLELFRFRRPGIRGLKLVACSDERRLKRIDEGHDEWMQLRSESEVVALSTIARLMNDPALQETDMIRYAAALSHYRMGMQAMQQSSRFVSLWVSLESFCRTPAYENIVECIACRVPELLTITRMYRLIRNYYEDCRRAGIGSPGQVVQHWGGAFTRTVAMELVSALRDPTKQSAMRSATATYSLLSRRTEQLIALLSDLKIMAQTLVSEKKRLYWHVQRLYRVRNSIVHTGAASSNLTALAEHLQDYVSLTLTRTSSIIASGKAKGIDVALAGAVDNYEATIEVLRKEQGVDSKLILDGAFG